MNINSAMFEPRHNSFVQMEKLPKTLKVSGYAMHTQAEATKSSVQRSLWIPENRGRSQSSQETEVDMDRLLDGCEEICCRAWDSNQNCQPVQLTWTVMGMLNNPIYRIKIHRENGMMWFEHPTQGSMPGGWMTDTAGQFNEKFAAEATAGKTGVAPLRPVAAVWKGAQPDAVKTAAVAVPKAEVALVAAQPAGFISRFLFRPVFGLVGQLWKVFTAPVRALSGPAPFLNPKLSQQLCLSEKIIVNHDTRIFRFKLPSPSMRLGLPTGLHMTLKAKVDGKPVMRAYTPMTDDSTLGHVDLLVKVYFKGVNPNFPEGGKMSQHLESMKIGDAIDVKGPIGEFVYKGKGHCMVNGKPRFCKEISMIAGGTGLTPCYQVLAAILRDPKDNQSALPVCQPHSR